jgi:hypothetical protein
LVDAMLPPVAARVRHRRRLSRRSRRTSRRARRTVCCPDRRARKDPAHRGAIPPRHCAT